MTTAGQSYCVAPNAGDNNSTLLPVGSMINFGGATAPSGWLICDGSAVSRTIYANLFAVLGITYGVGDGSTTFNLPNTAGKTIRGVDVNYVRGNIGGVDNITLTADQLPPHRHGQLQGGNVNVISSGGTTVQGNQDNVDNGTRTVGTFLQATNTPVANNVVNVVNPYVAVPYIIKF